MARRNYQYEKRQKELAKKKKKEDKRLRKLEKKEAEASVDTENLVEGEGGDLLEPEEETPAGDPEDPIEP